MKKIQGSMPKRNDKVKKLDDIDARELADIFEKEIANYCTMQDDNSVEMKLYREKMIARKAFYAKVVVDAAAMIVYKVITDVRDWKMQERLKTDFIKKMNYIKV